MAWTRLTRWSAAPARAADLTSPSSQYEITIYTSCCNATRGIYYYTTYGNPQITAVAMHRTDLQGSTLTHYPLLPLEIKQQN